MNFRKLVVAAAGAASATALALGTAGAASAGVSGTPDFTNASANPVSGYYATGFNTLMTHVQSYVGLQYNSNEITPASSPATARAGLGDQLCNDNNGNALQTGAIYNGNGTFTVAFGYGEFSSVPPAGVKNNGDPCEDGLLVNVGGSTGLNGSGGVQTGTINSALDAVPYGDTVEVNILYTPSSGRTTFEAAIIQPNAHWYSATVWLPRWLNFNEAAVGVQSDTTGLSAPAGNQLDGNAHWTISGWEGSDHGVHFSGFGDNSSHWTAVPVDSTGTGNGPVSQSLLLAGPIHMGNFSEYEGTPTG